MTTTRRAPAGFYRAAEVAEMLRCSPWWIKEQARQRRIPYSWIGGSYLFTEQHIAQIVSLFEVPPEEQAVSTAPPVPRRPIVATDDGGSPARLTARAPRRRRAARTDAAA